MTNCNIQKLIDGGEGLTVEFKKAQAELPKSLFETICAFLNRQGGIILLGVADDKTVVGVDPDKSCDADNLQRPCGDEKRQSAARVWCADARHL